MKILKNPPKILNYIIDKHNCALIENLNLSLKISEFSKILKNTITEIKKKKKKAIFLKLTEKESNLIQTAISQNFKFHHIKKNKIILLKKLKDLEIPEFATHHIGVGGIVLSQNLKKILLVKQKKGKRWKVPTGRKDLGENIEEGILREIFEETKINCRFLGVLFFREFFPVTYEMGDFFFLNLLIAENDDIIIDKNELDNAEWKSFKFFFNLGYDTESYKLTKIYLEKIDKCYGEEEMKKLVPFENFVELRTKDKMKIYYYHKQIKL